MVSEQVLLCIRKVFELFFTILHWQTYPGVQGFMSPAPPIKVPTTNILINNIPLAEYL